MQWIGRNLWEIAVAPGWSAKQDDECLTLVKSDEGALQVSSATKKCGLISQEEIRDFYEPRVVERGSTLQEYSTGAFLGFTASSLRNGCHWQEYWLAQGSLLLFVTYNGTPAAWRAEGNAVKEMLTSLRIQAPENELPA